MFRNFAPFSTTWEYATGLVASYAVNNGKPISTKTLATVSSTARMLHGEDEHELKFEAVSLRLPANITPSPQGQTSGFRAAVPTTR